MKINDRLLFAVATSLSLSLLFPRRDEVREGESVIKGRGLLSLS